MIDFISQLQSSLVSIVHNNSQMEMCVSGILGVICRAMEPPHGIAPCRWWSWPADVVLGPAADTARQPAGRGSFRQGARPGAQLCCTDASPRSVRAP